MEEVEMVPVPLSPRDLERANEPASPVAGPEIGDEDRMAHAAKENALAWYEAYRSLMAKSIDQVHVLLGSKEWVEETAAGAAVLYSRFSSNSGFYTFKATAVLRGVRPERLMHVVRDHDPETRRPWDSEDVADCAQLETFPGGIHVVRSRVRMPAWLSRLGVWDRHLLGIVWSGYDRLTRTYKLVFRTTQHRYHRADPDTVAVVGLVGVVVRALDDDNGRRVCELIVVMHVNPGDRLPSAIVDRYYKAKLLERVALYARVAGADWNTFYGKKN
jgi:hypothetical protein